MTEAVASQATRPRTVVLGLESAIINSRSIAPRVDALARHMGLSRMAVERLIVRSEALGLVAYWHGEDRVTLSPLGAERLRVKPRGHRWARVEASDPTNRILPARVPTVVEADLIDRDPSARIDALAVDREPPAELALAEREEAEAAAAELATLEGTQRRTLPLLFPRHFTGFATPGDPRADHSPDWHLGRDDPPRYGGPTPVRPRSRRLGLAEYCLICDAMGTDAHQPADRRVRVRVRKKAAKPAPPPSPRLTALVELMAAMMATTRA